MTGGPFSAEVVAAVCRHMNDDHAEGCRTIVRGLGGMRDATSAELVDLDETGVVFRAEGPASLRTVRIPWGAPVSDRPRIREEVVRMHTEALARLTAEG